MNIRKKISVDFKAVDHLSRKVNEIRKFILDKLCDPPFTTIHINGYKLHLHPAIEFGTSFQFEKEVYIHEDDLYTWIIKLNGGVFCQAGIDACFEHARRLVNDAIASKMPNPYAGHGLYNYYRRMVEREISKNLELLRHE